ncbi:MAG: CGNR zinc finger domain-containing protein [Chloroflexi bacterium]|nr:CGNR zinc finger domain-containing protein [Chloroflexota bacterium]
MNDARLSLLFAFLNSHDLDDWDDALVPEHYGDWVRAAAANGLVDGSEGDAGVLLARLAALAGDPLAATTAELAAMRDVRDGLIAMLLDEDDATLAAVLDGLARDLPLRLRVPEPGRVELEPAGAGPLAIAAAALVLAHDAAVDGTWPRIRLCHADDCHWAFVDRSRNGSRRWCSMGDCGARAKARAYRARQRAGV